jgi:dienelactone hydrolase
MLRDGRFSDLEARFAPALRAAASAETVRAAWMTELARIGALSVVGEPTTEDRDPGLVRVTVRVGGERGELSVVMSLDPVGVLHGLRLVPADVDAAWTPPPYAAIPRLTERQVAVGAGSLRVEGTLTAPRRLLGWRKEPAVVLLGGGGPVDRDGSTGPNKPMKDLAWGLATLGIASIRFDKVTYVHGEQVATRPEFTMTDEYVPYAIAAVRLLREQTGVDGTRVYVLGHSMGGKAAPRVAAAEPSVAGLVIMAGDASPMHGAAVRVTRYLAHLNPGPAAEEAVRTAARQASLVDSLDPSGASPSRDLPLGLSAAYWLDQRDYDPVAAAASIDRRMLIVQGGRDYQVTVDDDLARWRAGLEHRSDVTIRVYPDDDHLFFSGTGPSTPDSYYQPQHVDGAVIRQTAEWIRAGDRRP